MRFFRPWHACHHAEFRQSMGHRHHGHPFGRHADGDDFARHLWERVGARLDLDDEQYGRLGAWFDQLQRQRDALKGLVRGPELASTPSWTRCAPPGLAWSPPLQSSSIRWMPSSARRCAS